LQGKRNKTLKACKEIPATLPLRRTAVKFDAACSFFAPQHLPTLRENPPEAATRNSASFAAISVHQPKAGSFLRKEWFRFRF